MKSVYHRPLCWRVSVWLLIDLAAVVVITFIARPLYWKLRYQIHRLIPITVVDPFSNDLTTSGLAIASAVGMGLVCLRIGSNRHAAKAPLRARELVISLALTSLVSMVLFVFTDVSLDPAYFVLVGSLILT